MQIGNIFRGISTGMAGIAAAATIASAPANAAQIPKQGSMLHNPAHEQIQPTKNEYIRSLNNNSPNRELANASRGDGRREDVPTTPTSDQEKKGYLITNNPSSQVSTEELARGRSTGIPLQPGEVYYRGKIQHIDDARIEQRKQRAEQRRQLQEERRENESSFGWSVNPNAGREMIEDLRNLPRNVRQVPGAAGAILNNGWPTD